MPCWSLCIFALLRLHGVLIPMYHNLYQDPFMAVLMHKCDIRAIALQGLVRQDCPI